MEYANKQFYKNELTLQKILLFGTMLLYLTFFFGLMMQFVLGVFQVMSGLVHAIYFKDPRRQKYLIGVVGYFLISFSLITLNTGGVAFTELIGLLWGIIVPMGIAVWYYRLTKQDVETFEAEEENYAAVAWQENILDA